MKGKAAEKNTYKLRYSLPKYKQLKQSTQTEIFCYFIIEINEFYTATNNHYKTAYKCITNNKNMN